MLPLPQLASVRPATTLLDWLLVAVLSSTAGAADVTAFLGLGGLFVAHITGNLVVLAAYYVTGGFSPRFVNCCRFLFLSLF